MSEQIPNGQGEEPEFDPEMVERLRKQIEENKTAERDIKAKSALSMELWEHLVTSRSISKMVTDMGGLDEIERVYGKRDRDGLEQRIIEESEKQLKGE